MKAVSQNVSERSEIRSLCLSDMNAHATSRFTMERLALSPSYKYSILDCHEVKDLFGFGPTDNTDIFSSHALLASIRLDY